MVQFCIMTTSDKHQKNKTEYYCVGFNDVYTTPLGLAAFSGNGTIIEEALAKGIDWEQEYDSPVEGALMGLHEDTALKLMAAGSPINVNIFRTAQFINSEKVIKQIFATNTIIDWRPSDSDFWLKNVVTDTMDRGDNIRLLILDYVLAKGANPNLETTFTEKMYEGWSVLHVAAYRAKLAWLQKLITAGADINKLTPQGYSPLFCCAAGVNDQKPRNACMDFLEQQGGKFTPSLTLLQKINVTAGKRLDVDITPPV